MFLLLSVFKVIDRLAALFTPVVTGVYLLLLVMQLSQPIIKGILGIGYRKDGVDGLVFGTALVVIAAAFMMTNSNIMFLSNILFYWPCSAGGCCLRLPGSKADGNAGSAVSAAFLVSFWRPVI